jgi:hypothetical protein
MKTPTVGSTPGMELFTPKPRIEKFAVPLNVPTSSMATFGIHTERSIRSRTFKASTCSLENAEIEMGTCCRGSSRFRAVTTTSSSKADVIPTDSASSFSCAKTGRTHQVDRPISTTLTVLLYTDIKSLIFYAFNFACTVAQRKVIFSLVSILNGNNPYIWIGCPISLTSPSHLPPLREVNSLQRLMILRIQRREEKDHE